jgi:hypothetical protein
MKFVNVLKESLGHTHGSIRMTSRNEMSVFCELINKHENAVFVVRTGQTFHKIERNYLPRRGWNRKRFQQSRVLRSVWLGLLANLTRRNQLLDINFHPLPSKELFESSGGYRDPGMATNRRVVQG